jgi:hypothetical protein
MKKLLAALTFLLMPAFCHADLINGGFETLNFTGWSTIGDVSLVDSSFGVDPPQGHLQVLLTTAPAPDGTSPFCLPVHCAEHPQSYSGTNA